MQSLMYWNYLRLAVTEWSVSLSCNPVAAGLSPACIRGASYVKQMTSLSTTSLYCLDFYNLFL